MPRAKHESTGHGGISSADPDPSAATPHCVTHWAPILQFEVMDACDCAGLETHSFDSIVDKSLIDTLRCCTGSGE